MGMFLTKDPFEGMMDRVMSRNGYTYVEGNPVNYTDPSGKFINFLIGGLVGGVIGTVFGVVGGHVYGEAMYAMAAQGSCGCERQQEVLAIGRASFVQMAREQGALFGAIFGAVAGTGGIGMMLAGAGGIGLGAYGGLNTVQDIIANGLNYCNAVDLLLSVAGVLGGVSAARAGYNRFSQQLANDAARAIAEGFDDGRNSYGLVEEPLFNSEGRFLGLAGNRLPGRNGFKLPRALTPEELVDLTRTYDMEFGLAQDIVTGEYWLYSGDRSSVAMPFRMRQIYHTHPSGTNVPGRADFNVLRQLHDLHGQEYAEIVPVPQGDGPIQIVRYYWNQTTNDFFGGGQSGGS
jgi:hypothetical protein